MNFLYILHHSQAAFNDTNINDKIKSSTINYYIITVGMVFMLSFCLNEYSRLEELKNTINELIYVVFVLLILSGVASALLTIKLLSLFLYKIGNHFKGKATLLQIRFITMSSAMISGIVFLLSTIVLKAAKYYSFNIASDFYWYNLVFAVINIAITTKIMLIGLSIYNKFGYKKALLNYSPFLTFDLTIFLIKYAL